MRTRPILISTPEPHHILRTARCPQGQSTAGNRESAKLKQHSLHEDSYHKKTVNYTCMCVLMCLFITCMYTTKKVCFYVCYTSCVLSVCVCVFDRVDCFFVLKIILIIIGICFLQLAFLFHIPLNTWTYRSKLVHNAYLQMR